MSVVGLKYTSLGKALMTIYLLAALNHFPCLSPAPRKPFLYKSHLLKIHLIQFLGIVSKFPTMTFH